MQPQYFEIQDIEPKVVDLSINHDEPVISVRMPIYKLDLTHDTHYFESCYKVVGGKLFVEFNLSDKLIQTLHSSKALLAQLPLMSSDQVPHGFTLGMIDNVFIAVKKLKEFHDRGDWRPYISQYITR